MKDIISDSLLAHFIMFLFVMLAIFPMFSTIPWLAIIIGCGYVLTLFHSAIKIADFEMSKLGEVVKIHESGEYRRMDVYFTK